MKSMLAPSKDLRVANLYGKTVSHVLLILSGATVPLLLWPEDYATVWHIFAILGVALVLMFAGIGWWDASR